MEIIGFVAVVVRGTRVGEGVGWWVVIMKENNNSLRKRHYHARRTSYNGPEFGVS